MYILIIMYISMFLYHNSIHEPSYVCQQFPLELGKPWPQPQLFHGRRPEPHGFRIARVYIGRDMAELKTQAECPGGIQTTPSEAGELGDVPWWFGTWLL